MHTPSKLFSRDYTRLSLEEEKEKQQYIEKPVDLTAIRTPDSFPYAVHHNCSLFPNNYILLREFKDTQNLEELNNRFDDLIHREGTLERQVLNFINQTPAYHIVASILMDRFPFGHHECYLFKEFWLGDKFRTDHLLIGKGSGGYEFVLVEFEKPDGYITLKNGYWGAAFRNGEYQVRDWKTWLEGNYNVFIEDLLSVAQGTELPTDIQKYDSTRFHYVVIAGLRDDFSDTTYRERRAKMKESDIHLLHHDNLLDNARTLLQRDTF